MIFPFPFVKLISPLGKSKKGNKGISLLFLYQIWVGFQTQNGSTGFKFMGKKGVVLTCNTLMWLKLVPYLNDYILCV